MTNNNRSKIIADEGKFFVILLAYLILSYFVSIILFNILFPHIFSNYSEWFLYILTFILVLGSVIIIGNILAFIVTIIIYKRTKYRSFLIEGISHLFTGIVIVIAFVIMFKIQSFMSYAPLVIILPNFTYILIKKPLIWDNYYNRNNPYNYRTKEDIIFRQSTFINQFQDGYTSRPYFLSFSEVFTNLGSTDIIERKLLNYAKFLSVNGDLIGYNKDKNKINFYLRTALIQKIDILNPITLFNKILHIILANNVSTISFDLESKEISFKLSKSDYSRLNDITYHQFVKRILKQIKIGFEKFCEGKFIDSYEEIMPPVPHLNYSMVPYYILAFFGLGYVIGGFTVGLFYFYVETIVYNQSLSYTLIYILAWPFFTYGYFQNVFDIVIGKPDINNIMKFIPQVILVNLLALLLTCVIFYPLFKLYKRKINDPMKGIKIPKDILLNQTNTKRG